MQRWRPETVASPGLYHPVHCSWSVHSCSVLGAMQVLGRSHVPPPCAPLRQHPSPHTRRVSVSSQAAFIHGSSPAQPHTSPNSKP